MFMVHFRDHSTTYIWSVMYKVAIREMGSIALSATVLVIIYYSSMLLLNVTF